MKKKMINILVVLTTITYAVFGQTETVTIYATQSAQYNANDCCTFNSLTNINGDELHSSSCFNHAVYGCLEYKNAPLWTFDLSTLSGVEEILSIQFNGNLPIGSWVPVYISISSMTGNISTSIASDLWNGGDWSYGDGQYNGFSWPMGDFSQSLPLEPVLAGITSGQLNVLAYVRSGNLIDNSGNNAPRLVIEFESIAPNLVSPEDNDVIEYSNDDLDDPFYFNWDLVNESNISNVSVELEGNLELLDPVVLTNTSAMVPYQHIQNVIDSLDLNWLDGYWNVSAEIDGETVSSNNGPFYVMYVSNVLGTDEYINTPNKFALLAPYPNPFNPTTTIRFSVETQRATSLHIYNITGTLVETLVDGELANGEYEVTWNASSQPSGLYFVKLMSGNNIQTEKVILIK